MIEYRLATARDIEELARIRLEFLVESDGVTGGEKAEIYENNLEYFKRTLGSEFVAWIAVEEGEIIGTSGVSFYVQPPNKRAPTGKFAYISNMFTYPQHRGRGVATKLFALTVDEAKSRGYTKITLKATAMGRPIYEKYGFTDVSGDMAYYL